MKWARTVAIVFLLAVSAACLLANVIAPASYAHQFREEPNASPSRQHLLGTDDLGRDRFARVLYGTRVSLLLAPAAALLSSLLAAFIGGIAGFAGGRRGTLRDGGHGSFPVAALAFLADHGSRAFASERFSDCFGVDHIRDAGMPGLGRSGSHHLRRCAGAGAIGFHSSGTSFGQHWLSTVVASSCAQSEARALMRSSGFRCRFLF